MLPEPRSRETGKLRHFARPETLLDNSTGAHGAGGLLDDSVGAQSRVVEITRIIAAAAAAADANENAEAGLSAAHFSFDLKRRRPLSYYLLRIKSVFRAAEDFVRR